MATAYTEIFDLFLMGIEDYNIDALFDSFDTTAADVYMSGFLIRAIPYFDRCQQDLDDRNDSTRTFNITLTTDEKVILSELMIVQWYKKNTNDIKQMELHLSDSKAFKHYAEGQNLKEKLNSMLVHQEIVDKLMVKYNQKYIDWDTDV